MIEKSRAIVLHQLKYSETSVIVKLYTEKLGRQSYMVNGIRSSKSKIKMGLLQPLFLLEIEAYYKPGREMQRMKEFKLAAVYKSLPFDVVKSTMAMFLSELLNKVLRSEEPDNSLFDFIFHSLAFFDSMEKGAANFHLWFMIKLLGYLGYQLENNWSEKNVFFDMKAGSFVPQRPSYPKTPDTEESKRLSTIMGMQADQIHTLNVNGAIRTRLLEVLLECYAIHFDGIGNFNSLSILHEIYH
ncbi:MAG: DNA repair protein RecO [Prolixibacteraceae bacterium]